MAKRFLILDDEELEAKSKHQKNENTEKCERRAKKVFTNFLLAYGKSEEQCDFWNYEENILDLFLAKFWFGARKDICEDTDEGDMEDDLKARFYSANTLKNFRYGLNRILKKEGRQFDITDKKNPSFQKSQEAFFDAIKELKKEGKAEVKSKHEIIEKGTILSDF